MSDAAQHSYELAQQLHRQGRYAEAERHYRSILAFYGEYVGLLLRLAEVCFLQQHFEDAAEIYKRAVAVAPENATAHGGLGCSLNELGRPEEALPLIQRALSLGAGSLRLHLGEGKALSALGRPEEALVAFGKAITLDPANVEALCSAGDTLVKLLRYQEAITRYEMALTHNPDYVPALNNLGATLLLTQDWEQAAVCFRRALRIDPNLATAHFGLGRALQNAEEHEEAVKSFRAVVALAPGHVLALNLLGRSLSAMGQAELASEAFQKSLASDPANAETHFEIGTGLKYLGRFAEARRAFEQALEIAPDTPSYWQAIVTGQRIRPGDPAVPALEAMLQRAASYSDADQVVLHFALAKAYDDLGRHQEAFACLKTANGLERRLSPYDEREELGQLQRIASLFSSQFIAARAGCGQPSDLPVFVVGMPRSGTTLVEQVLASHPKVFGAGELGDLARIFDSHQGSPEGLSPAAFHKVGTQYIERLQRRGTGAARVVNKMPGNFAAIGVIALALPNARIIHVRRDPLDTCFSCYFNLFTYGHRYAYDLSELGRYYKAYERLMTHWRSVLPPDTILEVRYEDLVGDLDAGARRIVSHCGLDWDARCLEFHKLERSVTTISAAQVRQPLFTTSIGRWRPYAQWLAPLREALERGEPA